MILSEASCPLTNSHVVSKTQVSCLEGPSWCTKRTHNWFVGLIPVGEHMEGNWSIFLSLPFSHSKHAVEWGLKTTKQFLIDAVLEALLVFLLDVVWGILSTAKSPQFFVIWPLHTQFILFVCFCKASRRISAAFSDFSTSLVFLSQSSFDFLLSFFLTTFVFDYCDIF